MDFDDHEEEQDEDMEIPVSASYDSLTNSTPAAAAAAARPKMGGPTAAVDVSKKSAAKYRECLKNHAVVLGGHAVDGCGEFMPAGEEGTLDALKCAACNCHRNFHRRETEGGDGVYHHHHHLPITQFYRTAPAGYLAAAPHNRPLALPSTSGGGGSRDDQEDMSNPSGGGGGGGGAGGSGSSNKKRFRTKFTQEQKDKMLAFAESLGWRIQKHDEAAVHQFCTETCIKRHVLKVWMHNNKHTLGKKP